MNIKQLLNSACAGYQNYLDLGQCYLHQPSASADNIDLGLNNSGYSAQPHPIIVNYSPKAKSVITGEYSPRRSRGEYSPQSLSLRRIIVLV